MSTVLAEYERRREQGAIKPDAAQQPVIAKLDALADALKSSAPSGLLAKFKKPPPPPKGLYIHGEVGRGKSKNGLGLIKKVENIMKAGNWGKTDSIVEKVLIDEAW